MNVGAISAYRPISYITPYSNMAGNVQDAPNASEAQAAQAIKTDEENANKKVDKTDPGYKCQTCENRKYQDGSNEHDVSFKSATKVAPEAAASAVRSHEQMHVNNAYQKAEQSDNAKVISASVTIHTSICPECGKTYVSGGTTKTQIKYSNEENPYQKNLKDIQGGFLRGINLDMEI
ncbi:MAG: hypothetical protein IJO60_04980 [Agathobacter sp.]|nr:hypothetical protein [Agathobacter sp.]